MTTGNKAFTAYVVCVVYSQKQVIGKKVKAIQQSVFDKYRDAVAI